MKWIYGKESGITRLFNPQYITAVDLDKKLFFTRDTSGGWTFEEEDLPLLLRLTGRAQDEAANKQSKTNAGNS